MHAKAGRILENLRRAMSSRARLLVVEYVIPDHVAVASGNGASLGKWLDLHMMVAAGGLERTEGEYRRLFADHGFRLTRVVPTAGDISVIEGRPESKERTQLESTKQATRGDARKAFPTATAQ